MPNLGTFGKKRVVGENLATFFVGERIMTHKVKPELTLYLAEEALKEKFSESHVSMQEITELQKNCRDYMSAKNLRKIYMRLMTKELRKMQVEAVYETLTEEEQEFLQMKYQKQKQMVAISLELNISVSQLHIRQHMILEKVSDFLLCRLREEDIFEKEKIVSMVKILARMLEFAIKYDPEREFIVTEWVEARIEKLDKYYELLRTIESFTENPKNSLHEKIIMEKLKNPQEKIEILSERCNADKSIVSRHLKSFAEGVKTYLE